MLSELKIEPLNPRDRSLIEEICFQLTGSRPDTLARLETCYVNLLRRMRLCGTENLREYLRFAQDSDAEFSELLSALTIHTTSWFREKPHFDKLLERAKLHIESYKQAPSPPPLRILSAACSSGEEVYTMALVLEPLREVFPKFDYFIEGWDIDPVSVKKAARAIYEVAALDQIPQEHHRFVRKGEARAEGFFTLAPSIRQRCSFSVQSLDHSFSSKLDNHFQAIFCRNVLIYFKGIQVERIIRSLLRVLDEQGALFLGHSESIVAADFGLKSLGNAVYSLDSSTQKRSGEVNERERATAREITSRLELKPPKLILVGASTGGTEALLRLLKDMPRPCPPVVVVQHIATSFAKSFAERLSKASGLELGTPRSGIEVKADHLYMAWDDYHIGLKRSGGVLQVETNLGPQQHSVRPAVDFLFESSAILSNAEHIIAVLLTGMGKDGALGLLRLRKAGAMTFTQDEASSIVYGMPGEAVALGASSFSGSPEQIRRYINKALVLSVANPY